MGGMGTERTDTFRETVKSLARARGLSVSRVGHAAWDPDVEGTSPETLKKAMENPKPGLPPPRRPPLALMEALARALDVPPETFAEYRLAKVRQLLDEQAVGLDQAAAHLEALVAALAVSQAEGLEDFARALEALGQQRAQAPAGRARKRRAQGRRRDEGSKS
jgi:hypothetical protein